MKVLFICNDPIAGGIAYRLAREGHDVKMYIAYDEQSCLYDGLVKKTKDWKGELSWVTKKGLIVFDDVGYGADQDRLREQGYTVFGGSARGELLEIDRVLAANFFENHGLYANSMIDFDSPKKAMEYVKKNPAAWVIKQNNLAKKDLDYIGVMDTGRDTIAMLERYNESDYSCNERITLQKTIKGIEVAVGRYFNGRGWVGPIGINFEHNRLFPGDIGPITSEMGTFMWYTEHEGGLYEKTLKPFTDYLRKTNYRGCFDVNCIINEQGIFPIEATCRLGSPITYMHDELHVTSWGDFLYNVASQSSFVHKWYDGYAVVVLVTVPTFPYKKIKTRIYEETEVFLDNLTEDDMKHVHIEGLYRTHNKSKNEDHYYVGDPNGYTLCVTGKGSTPQQAQEKAYAIIKKLVIPKMMYRNDIGDKFIREDLANLLKWGYLSEKDLPFGRVPDGVQIKQKPWWQLWTWNEVN